MPDTALLLALFGLLGQTNLNAMYGLKKCQT